MALFVAHYCSLLHLSKRVVLKEAEMGTHQTMYRTKMLCLTPFSQLSLDVEGMIWILCKCEVMH